MKKILSLILASIMTISLASASAMTVFAEEYVEFPDEVVRNYMVNRFDQNNDGKLSTDELTFNDYVTIDLSNTEAYSAAGLECIKAGSITYNFSNTSIQDIDMLFHGFANNNCQEARINIENTPVHDLSPISDIPPSYVNLYLNLGYGDYENGWDLSPLEGWNIIYLRIQGGKVSKGFTADKMYGLDAEIVTGNGLQKILSTTTDELDFVYINGDYAQYLPANSGIRTIRLWDSDNEDIITLGHKNLTKLTNFYLTFYGVDDLTPLRNMNIVSIMLNWPREENKTNVNSLFEQVLNFPSIINASYPGIAIYGGLTDLTPLREYLNIMQNDSIEIYLNYNDIALAYKDNWLMYEEACTNPKIYISFDRQFLNANNMPHDFQNGTSLWIDSDNRLNKQAYRKGETITYTVPIRNVGYDSATFEVTFYLCDEQWNAVDVLGGDKNGRTQVVTNLAPGQTVHKSISFSVNDNYVNNGTYDYFSVGALVTCDGEALGVCGDTVQWKENVDFYVPDMLPWGDTLKVNGNCAPGMSKVEIQTADGTVLAEADYAAAVFSADIDLPDSYEPTDVGTENAKTVQLKAVVTDEEGNKFESDLKTVSVVKSNLTLEDCHYIAYGSAQINYADDWGPSIFYYGNHIIIRTKFAGIAPEEIDSAMVTVNNGYDTYDMKKVNEGKYKDYYVAITDSINISGNINLNVQVTTTSGETYERLIGYGVVIIDPSGIITDENDEPIMDVKVTLQKLQEDGITWEDWDAENYLQANPVYTNEDGYYGWDVPEGTYRIIAEKEGYKPKTVTEYYSRDQGENTAITVLPPRLDVDFQMEYEDADNPPVSPMTDAKARTAVDDLLSDLKLPANSDEKAVTDKLMTVLTENMYVSFKSGTYEKTASTAETEGSITGTVLLENIYKDELQEIEVTIPLETLSDDIEYLTVLGDYADKLTIEKSVDEATGNIVFTIAPKDNNVLPELKLYTAVYKADKTLKNVHIITDNQGVLTVTEPSLGEGETYKLMLWDGNQAPLISAIN